MIFDRIQKLFSSIENPNVPLGWEAISHAIEFRGGGPSDAGLIINHDVAMRFGAVFGCVRVIAGTFGSLPAEVYLRKKSGGREKATQHRLWPILHDRANPQMSSMVWRESVQANMLLLGGGYSEIQYDNAGRVVNIWPLQAALTSPVRDENGFRFVTYDTPDGSPRYLDPDDVLYLPGLSFNGLQGLSVVGYARHAIGLGLAAEKFGGKFFANGAKLSGVISYPGKLSEKARANLQNSFEERNQGADNAHRTHVFEEGAKYIPLSVPPEDAQFLETRKYQRSEICGWFGVPPHMIGDLERATFSNIEQQDLEFAKHCIRPWLVRWEQEINWKLFRNTDYFCEFNLDGLLRGDFKSRQEGLQIQRQNGIIDTNEWRGEENYNPVPDADNVRIVPMNYTTPEKMKAGVPDAKEPGTSQDPIPPAEGRAFAFKPVFRDAIGRVINRKRDESSVEKTFMPVLLAMSQAVESKATDNFLGEYCRTLTHRSQSWKPAEVESIASSEFSRAVNALSGTQIN